MKHRIWSLMVVAALVSPSVAFAEGGGKKSLASKVADRLNARGGATFYADEGDGKKVFSNYTTKTGVEIRNIYSRGEGRQINRTSMTREHLAKGDSWVSFHETRVLGRGPLNQGYGAGVTIRRTGGDFRNGVGPRVTKAVFNAEGKGRIVTLMGPKPTSRLQAARQGVAAAAFNAGQRFRGR